MDESIAEVATRNAMAMLMMSGVGLLFQITSLIVALVLVRKAHHGAGLLMAGGSLISLLLTLARPLLAVAMPFLIGTNVSSTRMLATQGSVDMVFGAIGMFASVLHLLGIVKLAQAFRGEGAHAGRVRGESQNAE
jgi:hypothetical protein